MKVAQFNTRDLLLSIGILAAGLAFFVGCRRSNSDLISMISAALCTLPFIGAAVGILCKQPVFGLIAGLMLLSVLVLVFFFLQDARE
jgi:hypothetical protein